MGVRRLDGGTNKDGCALSSRRMLRQNHLQNISMSFLKTVRTPLVATASFTRIARLVWASLDEAWSVRGFE